MKLKKILNRDIIIITISIIVVICINIFLWYLKSNNSNKQVEIYNESNDNGILEIENAEILNQDIVEKEEDNSILEENNNDNITSDTTNNNVNTNNTNNTNTTNNNVNTNNIVQGNIIKEVPENTQITNNTSETNSISTEEQNNNSNTNIVQNIETPVEEPVQNIVNKFVGFQVNESMISNLKSKIANALPKEFFDNQGKIIVSSAPFDSGKNYFTYERFNSATMSNRQFGTIIIYAVDEIWNNGNDYVFQTRCYIDYTYE